MATELPSLPGSQASFPPTHWSVILAARDTDPVVAGQALERLCRSYLLPLYAFVRRRGSSPHDAQDITQEFILQFLERDALARVHPDAGRFRSFLLACFKNFLSNQRARDRSQRRGGGTHAIPIDTSDFESRYSVIPADPLSPDIAFDRRWAFALLEGTLGRLREEYAGARKLEAFEELQGFLPGGRGEVSRAELAAKRGVTPGAIDVAVHRLRQRFGELLREEVARTLSAPDQVDEELRHLMSVLGG